MEEMNTILEEVVNPMEETVTEVVVEELPKKPKNNLKNGFKEKRCNVIDYDRKAKTLDVKFNGYGIRIKDVEEFDGDFAIIKFKGEIGKPNFQYKF